MVWQEKSFLSVPKWKNDSARRKKTETQFLHLGNRCENPNFGTHLEIITYTQILRRQDNHWINPLKTLEMTGLTQ